MTWPDNFTYVTPEEAVERDIIPGTTLEQYQASAKNDAQCHCGQPVWRLIDLGMCFSCTTGETDASDDYELFLGGER